MSHRTWAAAVVVATGCVFGCLSGCAVGKPPPAETAMAVVEAGDFVFGMGAKGCNIPQGDACKEPGKEFSPGTPERVVHLDKFAIDVHEVTMEQYRYCEQMEKCSLLQRDSASISATADYFNDPAYNEVPAMMATWAQAQEYCKFVGKRLPTEFEWERVAGGGGTDVEAKRLYPEAMSASNGGVGSTSLAPKPCAASINTNLCNAGANVPKTVMSSEDDWVVVGGQKVWDLAGNVAEWTLSDADDPNSLLGATCDWSQPYTCGTCSDCLRTQKAISCATLCGQCQCGAAPGKKDCYAPCASPVCPRYLDDPAKPPTMTAKEPKGKKRVVRGGSYTSSTTSQCAHRFDYRSFTVAPNAPLPFLGFRCAKSL
jgi:formylglycine-generating enzyme required for sulfatase activity